MKEAESRALLERARKSIVAGVNSPVRAYRAVVGDPPFIKAAHGARVQSEDGEEFVDYVGSWGPAILGHAHPAVIASVQQACTAGLSFGAPTKAEVLFAETLLRLYPSMELLRCVSSGTEATMSALRVARGYTKRDVIVKFNGAYHGHADALLVKAGSGAATFGAPDSAGVPADMVKHTVVAEYNDVAGLEALFARMGAQIAAVIVEPVAGNMGCVPPEHGFLEAIITLCEQNGAVSIFDEVMTGCRLAAGGAQERFGLRPHMTCLGKVVGGGMPLAVYGGQREIMECVSPLGAVYQAGTLSGNPVAVAAGLTTIEHLTADLYKKIEGLGLQLELGLRNAATEAGVPACVQRVGSMLTLFFQHGPVRNWAEAAKSDTQRFGRWHRALLEGGVYWPAAQFEAAFIGAAHTPEDVEKTIAAAKQALRSVA